MMQNQNKANILLSRCKSSVRLYRDWLKKMVYGCEKFVPALGYLFCPDLHGFCLARFAYFFCRSLHASVFFRQVPFDYALVFLVV